MWELVFFGGVCARDLITDTVPPSLPLVDLCVQLRHDPHPQPHNGPEVLQGGDRVRGHQPGLVCVPVHRVSDERVGGCLWNGSD